MVHANTEVSLFDQVKVLNVTVRQLEKQIHALEEEKNAISAELKASKEYWRQVWEPRTLSSQEKTNCKQCVQILFASAKESLAFHVTNPIIEDNSSSSKVTSTQSINMTSKDDDMKKTNCSKEKEKDIDHKDKDKDNMGSVVDNQNTTEKEKEKEKITTAPHPPDTETLIAQSREELYMSVEKMDRAVLIELSIALGGLVQTMYIEREKAKAEDARRIEKKAKILANNEAKLKAKHDIEEEKKVRTFVTTVFTTASTL